MKKIFLLSLLLITTNAFADCTSTAVSEIKKGCTENKIYGLSDISKDDTYIWFCADTQNNINSIKIYVCESGYTLKELSPVAGTFYQGVSFDKLLQIMFYEDSQSKIDDFNSDTQQLYVGATNSGVMDAANPMIAGKIYNRKNGRIYIGEKNAETKSETPATDEEIAVYQQTIKELQKKIQQIEECTAKANVGEI